MAPSAVGLVVAVNVQQCEILAAVVRVIAVVLAAVSFLIGSQPWAIWVLFQETTSQITAREAPPPQASS